MIRGFLDHIQRLKSHNSNLYIKSACYRGNDIKIATNEQMGIIGTEINKILDSYIERHMMRIDSMIAQTEEDLFRFQQQLDLYSKGVFLN
jgi:hypothetical protein